MQRVNVSYIFGVQQTPPPSFSCPSIFNELILQKICQPHCTSRNIFSTFSFDSLNLHRFYISIWINSILHRIAAQAQTTITENTRRNIYILYVHVHHRCDAYFQAKILDKFEMSFSTHTPEFECVVCIVLYNTPHLPSMQNTFSEWVENEHTKKHTYTHDFPFKRLHEDTISI